MKLPMKMQKLVLLIPALLAALAISCCNAAAAPVRMQLTHVDAGRGLSGRELMHRMAMRSKARAPRLLSGSATAPVSPAPDADGGPGTRRVQLTFDTGSDLTWTQCLPCPLCFEQSLPYFDGSRSSTHALLPCDSTQCQSLQVVSCGKKYWSNQSCVYIYTYGDKSVTVGHLDVETITFGDGAGADTSRRASMPGVAFGCGLVNHGTYGIAGTGLAGFGRGPLSLPSQLKLDNFSYCLTAAMTGSKPSTILLDLPADLYSHGCSAVQTTPLIKNPRNPTPYYLSLKGITVGSKRLPVPESVFALKNGTGGTVIDSGTSIMWLPPSVYRLVREAFLAHVKLPVVPSNGTGPLLCFSAPPRGKPYVPKLVLHFEGATMHLPRENYVFEVDDDAGNRNICLAITEGDEMTIIGNFQQQNMHVLYDLKNSKLSFVHAQCDKL
uniref:Peptidase A1 domain-containing protein n=1 Tax=Oryza punctata TaxID=4537 RepID=A0A0E0KCZ6_ORYPU